MRAQRRYSIALIINKYKIIFLGTTNDRGGYIILFILPITIIISIYNTSTFDAMSSAVTRERSFFIGIYAEYT